MIYDISQTLRPGIPVWPGDTDYEMTETWEMNDTCPVKVSSLTLSTHTGSHADAPCHYTLDGLDSASTPLDTYLGPAQVIDLSQSVGALVTSDDLSGKLKDGVGRVLLKLFPTFPHDGWDPAFPAIHPETIDWLAAREVKLIGTDVPSLDPQESKTLDAHRRVAANGLAILEGLVLDAVPEGVYELIALPLKIEGADGSPVRAILRSL
ncbi:arylformamidase [Gimibacter soli]|uniref:Kynurenine formamidase n=1 Tax=Gimibacter soli TaxID=3024400 RepID=A0AAF0BK05_9PROT|nr:arylformamidase [Gimibacter soli]WCL53729.1 arylformamidase [Gimibacter soli]